jgi:hypothetical protein
MALNACVLGFQIELLKQPLEHSFLIVTRCPPDLSEQVNPVCFGRCRILQPLIAGRAHGSKVFRGIVTTLRLVEDVAHRQPDRPIAAKRVGIACRNPAHLAGVAHVPHISMTLSSN